MINRETSINMNHVPNSNRMDKLIFFGGGGEGREKGDLNIFNNI